MRLRRLYGRFVGWLASFDPELELNRVNSRWPVSDGKWCDYCACVGCQTGCEPYLGRRECADGTHICDVCFSVEPCVDGITTRGSSFCKQHPLCCHKPKLKDEPPPWA